MDLKELGDTSPVGHWYYETKFDSILDRLEIQPLPTNIVEIGAGSKFFIQKLLQKFPQTLGWAVDPNFTKDQVGKDGNLHAVLENPEVAADLYLFLDVLEHVEDDLDLLKSSIRNANSRATIVISVPAFNHLWSGHDIFLGHHRRYTIKELSHLVVSADLEIEKIYYTFSLIYPLVWIIRKIKRNKIQSDMKSLNPFANALIYRLLKLLSPLNSNRLFGLSAVAVARTR